MKTIVITTVLAFFSIVYGNAQTIPKDTTRWKKIVPEIKIPQLDTNVKRNNWSQSINAIDIPNVLQGKNTTTVDMPLVRLSGENMAPMPGTENLQKWDRMNRIKNSKDSIPRAMSLNKNGRGKN